MSILPLLVALILGGAAAAIVLAPLRAATPTTAAQHAQPLAEATERERTAKDALRDLELDYRLGNLGADDYQALRERYEARALAALRTRYTHEHDVDAEIERQLAALRAAPAHDPAEPRTPRTPGAEGTRSVTQRRARRAHPRKGA